MKKTILIVSNDMPLTLDLYSGLSETVTHKVEINNETDGALAYKKIKHEEPDLLVADLETPGLMSSLVLAWLDGITITDKVPTVAVSRALSSEEREILTDMMGIKIYPTDVSLNHLGRDILSSLPH